MKTLLNAALAASLLFAVPLAHAAAPQPAPAPAPQPATASARPKIEIVFALDTTSSMGGLIQAAKTKIWSIVNQISTGQPTPEVRVGLVAYRDRGDDYVTQVTDLTSDLDAMYARLMSFAPSGGGDGPESVNQALYDAVHKISWSGGGKVMRLIYLVGDWPPHMDYRDDVKYPVTAKVAVQRGIYINTIRCGNQAETERVWKDIAHRAEGRYFSIDASGGAVARTTPFDGDIARIDGELRGSAVLYGAGAARETARRKLDSIAATMDAAPAEAKAERAAYAARKSKEAPAAASEIYGGGADLISAYEEKSVDLDKVAAEALPDEMRAMSAAQRKAYVEKKSAERKAAQAKLDELNKKRAAYLADEAKKTGPKDSFDSNVLESVREKSAKIGVKY